MKLHSMEFHYHARSCRIIYQLMQFPVERGGINLAYFLIRVIGASVLPMLRRLSHSILTMKFDWDRISSPLKIRGNCLPVRRANVIEEIV